MLRNAAVLSFALLAVVAGPASAATLELAQPAGSKSVFTGTERLTLTAAGVADQGSLLSVVVGPGKACAPTLSAQAAAPDQQILYPGGRLRSEPTIVSGPFQQGHANLDPAYAPAAAGDHVVCGYLLAPAPGGGHDLAGTPAATAFLPVTVSGTAQERALASFRDGDLLPAANALADRLALRGLREGRARTATLRMRARGRVTFVLRTRGRGRAITLARGTRTLTTVSATGSLRTVTVRPTREGRRYLRGRTRVPVTLIATYDARLAGVADAIVRRPLTLR